MVTAAKCLTGPIHFFEDDWQEDFEDVDCINCDKKFGGQRHIKISYSTSKQKCTDNKCVYELAERFGHNPYIYKNKNWTIYKCKNCDDEVIKTGKIINNEPYIIELDCEDEN